MAPVFRASARHPPGSSRELPNAAGSPQAQARYAADRLGVVRRHKKILDSVSLSLAAGEVLGLLGANGAGKSTLLAALADELELGRAKQAEGNRRENGVSGTITLNGFPLAELTARQQARMRAVLTQKPGLTFDLDVYEVVAMGAYPYPELDEADVRSLRIQAMQQADVLALQGRRYLELSGGEQQRVHYARVVLQVLAGCHDPQVRYILLDEPTSSLDPRHQQSLLQSTRALARQHALGVLVILHDVNLAALYCDRIALLHDGELLACGVPRDVLTPDHLQEVYGVTASVMPHPRHPDRPLVVFG